MKKIGIGYEFYKEFIDQDLYYVDKTLLIRDIVKIGGKVNLFTRPRRFGKTLSLTMLKTFFELEYDYDGNIVDNRKYFEGKKIMEAGDEIVSRLGKYPVLFLTLKSAKQPDFIGAFYQLKSIIQKEIDRHRYLLDSDKLNEEEKEKLKQWIRCDQTAYSDTPDDMIRMNKDIRVFATAFGELSDMLKKHHGTGVVILLDEYDVPLESSYFAGFYNEMIGFIRSFFESALKTNTALEFAVITGCLRISRESIFTGLNHLKIYSIQSTDFGEYFGFTPKETEQILEDYNLIGKVEEVRKWYDGYLFGNTEVYNPWSVLYYVDEHRESLDVFAKPYWSNTSSNSIIKDLVYHADADVKEELDRLIQGGTIERKIHEDITYDDIYENEDNLWNFLYFTGYMKKVSERRQDEDIYITMCIPNAEIRSIYRNQIREWFDKAVLKVTDRSVLHKAVLARDTKAMESFFTELLQKTISTFDSTESFYHGFILSLLYGVPGYSVRSNREEGEGRPDIVLYPNRPKDYAFIFEIKTREKFNQIDDGIKEAFDQIKDKRYEEGILDDGYAGVVSFGVCCCKKSCIIELMR